MKTARRVTLRRLVLGFLVLVVAGIATGLIAGWIGSTLLGVVHNVKPPAPPAALASIGPTPSPSASASATASSGGTAPASPSQATSAVASTSSAEPTASDTASGGLSIASISPTSASAGQRVDLGGAYPGAAPGTKIQIQQQVGSGPWKDFPASTTVSRDGTWSMWIKTWIKGTQQLRVLDPATGTTSAPVTLTIS